jgi:PAS domain S-box-containing protein
MKRKAFQESRASQGMLSETEDLYNQAPCGFHSLDEHGCFVRVNETELRWLGYTRDELIGKKITDLLTPESAVTFQDHFPSFKLQGSVRDLEVELVCKDGSILPVLVSATAVRDSRGNFVMSRSVLYDITERKRADEKFKELLEAAPDAWVVANRHGKIVLVNTETERMFGYQRDELLGQDIEILIPWHFRDRHARHQANYFAQPKARRMGPALELAGRRKDGTEFAAEISLSPLRAGEELLVLSTIRDVTEGKRVIETLRESEERFRRVFEEGPLGLALVGKDHRFLNVNSAFSRLVGYSASELSYMSFEDITHPDDRQTDAALADQLFGGEVPFYQMSKRFVTKNGEAIWANLTRSVVSDQNGNPLYALSMIEDITQRKRMDETLRDSEERFRVALKNSPVVVFNHDRELRYTWINSPVLAWARCEYLGHTDAEILGREEGAHLMVIKQGVLDNGIGTRTEVTVTFEDETHYFDLTVEPLRDDQGAVVGITCAATDVTPLKQAAAEREGLIRDLQEALERVKLLSGLLPICAGCKMIRDEQGTWQSLEFYIGAHSEAEFTHGMCPQCSQKFGWGYLNE